MFKKNKSDLSGKTVEQLNASLHNIAQQQQAYNKKKDGGVTSVSFQEEAWMMASKEINTELARREREVQVEGPTSSVVP